MANNNLPTPDEIMWSVQNFYKPTETFPGSGSWIPQNFKGTRILIDESKRDYESCEKHCYQLNQKQLAQREEA